MAPVSTSATFLEQWLIAIADKKNCKAMSLDLYNEKVSELQAAMANPGGKSSKQQYLLKAFILVQGINGAMKLAKKRRSEEDNFLYVVPNEHLHDTISKEHIALGHAGITKMLCHTRTKYSNVTQEAITLFISLCEECERKKKKDSSKSILALSNTRLLKKLARISSTYF